MPQLDVYTNDDAEVFVMNAALSRVARSVGGFSDSLSAGLYKIRVVRAGTVKEQLIELTAKPQQLHLFVSQFSAIAPIGPMLTDVAAVQTLAQKALGKQSKPCILVLAHQRAETADREKPFGGASIFPWRSTRRAVRLDNRRRNASIGDELWSAVAVRADPADGPFVLELNQGAQVSRQAVLVAEGWQTRIFLRAGNADTAVGAAASATEMHGARAKQGDTPQFDVSIQMARPGASVVYSDHWETVEVARNALERGRAIFTGETLVSQLLYEKFDNPITGLTGLHLFLDAKERSEAGDATYELKSTTKKALSREGQEIADEVLANLTKLLHPDRAAAAEKQLKDDGTRREYWEIEAALQEVLLYPDPDWPESPDLTALRLRAGRCKQQVFVPSPAMFRVSWDVLKANAARDGLTWISRELWSSTGAAGSRGPYLAWARGRHSVERTLQRVRDQIEKQSYAQVFIQQVLAEGRTDTAHPGAALEAVIADHGGLPLESAAIRPDLEAILDSGEDMATETAKHELAASFSLPLSILQKAPRNKL
ncbi:hypothetical protein [Bradyrhizobium sp. WSM1743]|uniref:hypothetical protein n=1 Tax=Bradyrhizobium sp. WSM1743 TaxID=318996 RepID=UPI00040579B9|nr:hypothetical protein [Bradyrhizobium sp. WSM1743]